MPIQDMWEIRILHGRNRIDIYYCKDADFAEDLYQKKVNEFPKATVTKTLIKVNMEEN